MTAVDTNLLVRLFTNDDPAQARRAAEALRAGPVRVPKTVLLETEWVLRYSYDIDRAAILRALRGLVSVATVEVEDRANVLRALTCFEAGLDLADALHLASIGPATSFASFDVALRRRARRVRGAPPVVAP